jgi:hypothetical protein
MPADRDDVACTVAGVRKPQQTATYARLCNQFLYGPKHWNCWREILVRERRGRPSSKATRPKRRPRTAGPYIRVISAVLNGSLLVYYDKRTFSRLACFKGANGGLEKSSRIIASELSLQLH